ncbi:MAG: SDR family oxidoreductase [Rhodospirillales bacterium]|nr:SDR family oxidoreductase [Rhodospirillales bacterium]
MQHDRVVIVTGAMGGMGVAFTRKLLDDGWRVAALDLQAAIDAAPPLPPAPAASPGRPASDPRPPAAADAAPPTSLASAASPGWPASDAPPPAAPPDAAGAPSTAPDRLVRIGCDVADWESVRRAVDAAVARLGRVDAVVNGAGIVANIASIAKMDPAKWAWELSVNLTGPFHLIKATAPAMADSGWGRFVNISSQAAQVGLRYQSAYCASKAGLLGLMRVVVAEYGHKGVTCNTLLPGLIATPKVLGMPKDILDRAVEGIPTGRPGTVEEMAEAAAFLLSDKAAFINGATIDIDGGKHVQIGDLTRRREK